MSSYQRSSPPTSNQIVGMLEEIAPPGQRKRDPFYICSNKEVFIGRQPKLCHYIFDDLSISNMHLRVYTIIFDRENPQEIAPLVYVQDVSKNGTTWNGYPMGKDNGGFLLSDGDSLRLASRVSLQYHSMTNGDDETCFDMLQTIEMRAFEKEYRITRRKLGSGAYGQVHMAYDWKSGQQFACKIIDLRALKDRVGRRMEEEDSRFFSKAAAAQAASEPIIALDRKDRLQKRIHEELEVYSREAEILASLSHPNIIGVERVIKSSNTIYLFQDLVPAGDLFSYIQYKGGRLPNVEAAAIVRQCLMALEYLHDQNIVHRDIKPDNILMTSLADGCRIVLTDFGCAKSVHPVVGRMSTLVGTFDYSAPEVLQSSGDGYTKAVDLWSMGCVTVVLLTGEIPFKDSLKPGASELDRIRDSERLKNGMELNSVGHRARDFIWKLLQFDERRRMDVKQALAHSWFTNSSHREEFDALYRRSIQDWKPRRRKVPLMIELCDLIESTKSSNEASQTQISEQHSCLLSPETDMDDEKLQGDTESSLSLEPLSSRARRSGAPSPTLSDPELPVFERAHRFWDVSSQTGQDPGQQTNVGFRSPDSATAAQSQNKPSSGGSGSVDDIMTENSNIEDGDQDYGKVSYSTTGRKR